MNAVHAFRAAAALAAAAALLSGCPEEDPTGGADAADAGGEGDAGHSPGDPATALVATALAAAADFTCALTDGGEVVCWGDNAFGQLGHDREDDPAPAVVAGVSGATALAVSDKHACAVVGGGVRCWGLNGNAQLGDGGHDPSAAPVAVAGVSGAVGLALGDGFSCALVGVGVSCWGKNQVGQLGQGGSSVEAPSPGAVLALSDDTTQVEAGQAHTCALAGDGGVRCWGSGAEGVLGAGDTVAAETPVRVTALGFVTDLGIGWAHSCAVWTSGQIACWGRNQTGQLGNGKAVEDYPVAAAWEVTKTAVIGGTDGQPLEGAAQVAGGGAHSCALMAAGGTVRCWGQNADGQLGSGKVAADYPTPSALERLPVGVEGLAGAKAVVAGAAHSCALDAAGRVLCWGAGDKGQLGAAGVASPRPIYVVAPE